MEIIKQTGPNAVQKAVECLQNGEILIYPTETCYGVGVDATNEEAVSKVLKYKKRPEGKPISIGCTGREMASEYVEVNKTAENIYKNFLPGPITVVSNSKGKVDPRLESEKGSLGIRVPAHEFILEVIQKFGKPITTTSANSSGKKTPYKIQDIFDNISQKQKDLINLIIDAGELPNNPPSTVIDSTSEELTVYRKGALNLTREAIEKSKVYKTESVEETIQLGEKLMKNFIDESNKNKPIVVLLHGELGAGKTHMTKGFAKALGINQTIKSPTYTYVAEYGITRQTPPTPLLKEGEKRVRFYHVDAWRIRNEMDLELLDFDEMLKSGNVIVIEWPTVLLQLREDVFEGYDVVNVNFEYRGESKRKVTVY